jgi:hypothetical protein
MGLLKKIGLGIVKYLPILLGLGQVVRTQSAAAGPVIDKFAAALDAIAAAEQMAEAMGLQKGGPAKLAAVRPYVTKYIQDAEQLAGHKLHDDVAFSAGVDQVVSGLVACFDAYE